MNILFYDGACPLCTKEINKLKQLVPPSSSVQFENIHDWSDDQLNQQFNTQAASRPDREQLLKLLHLWQDGQWRTGLDVNLWLWEQTRFAVFARLLRFKPVYWLGQQIYRWWAKVRYQRLYCTDQCQR